jgi:hypothetical protein
MSRVPGVLGLGRKSVLVGRVLRVGSFAGGDLLDRLVERQVDARHVKI